MSAACSGADDTSANTAPGVDAGGADANVHNDGGAHIDATLDDADAALADSGSEDAASDANAASDADDASDAGAVDNCPEDFNPEQTDWDGDGQGDACDPHTAACRHATSDGACRGTLSLSDGNSLHYFRSHAIGADNSSMTRVIVVVHGNSNTPWSHFNAIVELVERNDSQNNTLIIARQQ